MFSKCKDNVKSGGVDVSKSIDKSVKHYTSNDVKHDDKSFLIIYKNHGKFYQCKNIDAYIMNTLFGYKVWKGDVSGFPDTAINKVINTLEDAKISYQIIDVDKDPLIKDFGKINTYSKYLDMSFKNLDKKKKVDFLIDKLNKCSIEKLESIISLIENEFK